jgi:hypothetical protein
MCACALTGPKNPARFECSLNSERNSESPVGPKKKKENPENLAMSEIRLITIRNSP